MYTFELNNQSIQKYYLYYFKLNRIDYILKVEPSHFEMDWFNQFLGKKKFEPTVSSIKNQLK